MIMAQITFKVVSMAEIGDDTIHDAATLLSSSYGVWDKIHGTFPGKRIRMTPERLISHCLFDKEKCKMVQAVDSAHHSGKSVLVGYCFFCQFHSAVSSNPGAWVIQLLVKNEYRSQGIARKLLASAWDFSNCFGMGLVTSHPHAVLALEKVTGRQVDTGVTSRFADLFLAGSAVPYLRGHTSIVRPGVMQTNFFADHDEVDLHRKSISDWRLGRLGPGQEYLAIILRPTFPT